MDMMMPEVDGITATRMIRAGASPRSHTTIIALTANALPSDRAACEAAGMNDFVTKPFKMDQLRDALERAMNADRVPPITIEAQDPKILDTTFLLRLGDEIGPEGVAEMVQVFMEDAPARMAAIRLAMAEGAIQAVRFEAHALTGAARNVGLIRLGLATDSLRRASEGAGPDNASIELVAMALDASLPLVAAWTDARHSVAAPVT